MQSRYAFLWLLAVSYSAVGQHIFQIRPSETNPQIEDVHGSHRVTVPILVSFRNKLVVSIPGTGSPAEGMHTFDSVAAQMGYHVISLDYKNNVITTVCRPSTDSLCFNKFRQEIVFGTPVSDSVQVDSLNSIYSRLYNLLSLLAKRYPRAGWDQFIRRGTIVWSKITTVGHSQGAGHAAFLAKHFKLDRAIMLAGPQDFMDFYQKPASWIKKDGKTPPNRFFALLHVDDPFGFQKQLVCDRYLTSMDTTDFQKSQKDINGIPGPPYIDSPFRIRLRNEAFKPVRFVQTIFVIEEKSDNPHSSVMMAKWSGIWREILSK